MRNVNTLKLWVIFWFLRPRVQSTQSKPSQRRLSTTCSRWRIASAMHLWLKNHICHIYSGFLGPSSFTIRYLDPLGYVLGAQLKRCGARIVLVRPQCWTFLDPEGSSNQYLRFLVPKNITRFCDQRPSTLRTWTLWCMAGTSFNGEPCNLSIPGSSPI